MCEASGPLQPWRGAFFCALPSVGGMSVLLGVTMFISRGWVLSDLDSLRCDLCPRVDHVIYFRKMSGSLSGTQLRYGHLSMFSSRSGTTLGFNWLGTKVS